LYGNENYFVNGKERLSKGEKIQPRGQKFPDKYLAWSWIEIGITQRRPGNLRLGAVFSYGGPAVVAKRSRYPKGGKIGDRITVPNMEGRENLKRAQE